MSAMSTSANRPARRVCRLLACSCLAVPLLLNAQDDRGAIARHAQDAQQAQREGDFATAIREFAILARLLPEVADVHSNLGVAYYFHKQPREALAAFERALRLKPNLVPALIFSGIAHFELSEPARATTLLERALELSPDDQLARTWLAHCAAAQGRFREAVDHFLVASRRAPRDVDIWYGLGRAYLELGRQEVERLTEVALNGARALQLAGDLWRLRGEQANALALYQEALNRRPGLAEVEQAIAELLGQQTSSQHAAASPSRPAAAQPTAPEDLHYLAATEFRGRAHHAFEQISALEANSHRAHQVLAESLEAQDRVDEALAEYRTVSRMKPDLAGIHLAVGNLLMSEGRAAEALEEYRAELLRRPRDAQVHYRMGRALIVLGQEDDAEASFNRALSLRDPPPAVHRELGRIHLSRDQPAKAVQALSTYLASNGNDAAAHYLLMRAHRARGDAAAAERHLAEYTRLSNRDRQQASLEAALSLFSRSEKPD
jgi:tetratricopeptide (TPR) repeat protein